MNSIAADSADEQPGLVEGAVGHSCIRVPQVFVDSPRFATEQAPHVKTVLQRQVEATDREIDQLVYELYGLTEAEIAVVEGDRR